MHLLLAWILLAGGPFWETKPPQQWTKEELGQLMTESPWAKMIGVATPIGNVPAVQVYLASAAPMQQAEEEFMRRKSSVRPEEASADDEYREFLRENPGRYIVLAVHMKDLNALANARDAERVQEESILRIGKRKYKIVGHFPPTPSDPYLRLIYPREVKPDDKKLRFELYLPLPPAPYRGVEFEIKDLVYKGKPEM